MALCNACPRGVSIDRSVNSGVCGVGDKIKIARAAPHFWEEPCISGTNGSGTVFFSGCNMKCVYCQNYEISTGAYGREVTAPRLCEIYKELVSQGVHNINLVTPSHYVPQLLPTLDGSYGVPVVYNSSGYDSVETLKMLDGRVQIYLPDMKYMSSSLAKRYSAAPDYPEIAKNAIREMYRQAGECVFDENGIMQSGVVIRHLMLPDETENTLDVIDWVSSEFGDSVVFSLMSQFTPNESCKIPALTRKITEAEYNRAVDYIYLCGMENVYVQDFSSAEKIYTPPFDLTGL